MIMKTKLLTMKGQAKAIQKALLINKCGAE